MCYLPLDTRHSRLRFRKEKGADSPSAILTAPFSTMSAVVELQGCVVTKGLLLFMGLISHHSKCSLRGLMLDTCMPP